MPYIGKLPTTGNFIKLDTISVVNGQATYSMQKDSVNFSPGSAQQMLVSLNGIIQNPGSSYTISAHQITFASNLVTGDVFKFDGKILEPDDWKDAQKYRHCFRVEKIGSELMKEEEK